MDRGFILQSTYRVERGRPVIHLFGVTEERASFVYRDTRVRPSFFLRAEDLPKARPILEAAESDIAGFPRQAASDWQAMDGAAAVEIEVALPPDVPPLRDALRSAEIEPLEADVPFVTRYLSDRGLRGALGIEGTFRKGKYLNRIYEDVALVPVDFAPTLRVLAIDIETDPQMERIFSFALYANLPLGGHVAEVHVVAHPDHAELRGTVGQGHGEGLCFSHPDEAALLRAFMRRIIEIDPDVLTGWNVIDFDLRVIAEACQRIGLSLRIGRADLPCRVLPRGEIWGSARAIVHGRAVIDGIDMVRGAFIRLDQYSLDTAARTILGEGKLVTGTDRAAQIERMYRHDLETFLLYNLTDARLVVEILEQKDLVALAVERAHLTGLPIERVAGSIAAFDFLYLGRLHRDRIAAPTVQAESTSARYASEPTAVGGHVLDSAPGIYENVWLFDYRSLYPSIIRTFGIDPRAHARARVETDPQKLIRAPNGAIFLRDDGILPEILAELFPRRAAAQRAGEQVVQTAIKILMNSFYGVLATPHCRFFSTEVSNAITTFGQQILLWTRDRLVEYGYPVIYGDTDSVFALSGMADPEEAARVGAKLVERLNREIAAWVTSTYGVESHLLLEYERLYLKFFMPTVRHGSEGSKKRYAGIIDRGAGRELVFTGLESVRRDWTVLAKDFQRHILLRVFDDLDPAPLITEFIEQLRAGARDGDLVYRKALRKPLDAYGKTTPPHVKAARLIPGKPERIISYVLTVEGPQPLGYVTAPIDYEHYLEKQIRPIAEAILQHVAISFDEILGKGGQLGLL